MRVVIDFLKICKKKYYIVFNNSLLIFVYFDDWIKKSLKFANLIKYNKFVYLIRI